MADIKPMGPKGAALVMVVGPGIRLANGNWFNLTDWKSANQLESLALNVNAAASSWSDARVKSAESRVWGEAFRGVRDIMRPFIDWVNQEHHKNNFCVWNSPNPLSDRPTPETIGQEKAYREVMHQLSEVMEKIGALRSKAASS